TYKVQTRDKSPYQNIGNFSSLASDTTPDIEFNNCPAADLDGNCIVDEYDLDLFTQQWLALSGCVGHPDDCADLDQQDDGINFDDYAYLAYYWKQEGAKIVINEVMASNDGACEDCNDPQGHFDDWIEIFNMTNSSLDIGGLYLEDGGSNRWQIPTDRPSETTIDAYDYLIIWADNDTTDTPGLHASFKLNAGSDAVYLYDVNNNLLDSVIFEDQLTDYSLGRFPDANESWYAMNSDNTTPGNSNKIPSTGQPYFSHPGGTFTTSFNLALTTLSGSASIYYTTDGSEPTQSSSFYSGTISVDRTMWVRARAYDSGFEPSPIVSKTYIKLATDVQSFESNLPIVIIDSFGVDVDNENRDFHPVISAFIDTDEITGRAAITDSADYSGYGGLHIRGNSTEGYDKRQFRFETWDEYGEDKNVSLLGLPSESDWIIHGPWSDRTLMRNYQMYTWSNLIGRYASRTIFIEVFLDYDDNGTIDWDTGSDGSNTDYRGIYVLMEKIKRDNNRVDIERLESFHNSEPEITGGYIFEKGGGDDVRTATYDDSFSYNDPETHELTATQKTWV
ncbi:MAG: CotH kinase family protein, partial [Planctomycetota bacterium]